MLTKVIIIDPEGDMNVCTEFHGHPSVKTSPKNTYINFIVALEKESGDPQCLYDWSGPMNICGRFCANEKLDLLVALEEKSGDHQSQ